MISQTRVYHSQIFDWKRLLKLSDRSHFGALNVRLSPCTNKQASFLSERVNQANLSAERWTITIACEQRLHFRSVSEVRSSTLRTPAHENVDSVRKKDDYRDSPTIKFCWRNSVTLMPPFSQMPSLHKAFLKQSIFLNAVWLEHECEKILETPRMFWSKLRKSTWLSLWNLAFPTLTSPIVCIFQRATQRPRLQLTDYWYRAGAAVV